MHPLGLSLTASHRYIGIAPRCACLAAALLLVACTRQTASQTIAAPPPTPSLSSGRIDAARLANVANEPDAWLTSGRDGNGSYFSPLKDINADTVGRLGFAWDYHLSTTRGLEATPIVVDGVMYAVGPYGRVFSLDAKSGKELWTYDPQIDGQYVRYTCCDAVSRGLAVWGGKVYVGAVDGWLHAIDAQTGKTLWKADTLVGRSPKLQYTVTGAPQIAGDVVVIGNSGADFSERGYVSAYDLQTGAFKWRFFTVPHDPKLGPQEQAHLDAALKTFDPRHQWEYGGGGTVWDGMGYDAEHRLLYIGTGNLAPFNLKLDGRRGGDGLYAASIIAIHADTGELAWYFQPTPGDQWDFDNVQKLILADLNIDGSARQVLMQASKNGFFYVIDRVTGGFISAKNFVFENWTRGLDPKTGRPTPTEAVDFTHTPKLVYPSTTGGHNWQPMSFDADTGLVYIPAFEAGQVEIESSKRPIGYFHGMYTVVPVYPEDYNPAALKDLFGSLPSLESLRATAGVRGKGGGIPKTVSVLRAWDPVHQSLVWEQPVHVPGWSAGGVLSTAGNLVIQGDTGGTLTVFAADTGRILRRINAGTSIIAAPMTYKIEGQQFVAVMAGLGGGMGLYTPYRPQTAAFKYGNDGRIIVLKLDGCDEPKPALVVDEPFTKPPPREGTPESIAQGAMLYTKQCSRCHVMGRGILPDLRRMSAATHSIFYDIVLHGVYVRKGMGRFDDVLSESDARTIHAYLLSEAWTAYETAGVKSAQPQIIQAH